MAEEMLERGGGGPSGLPQFRQANDGRIDDAGEAEGKMRPNPRWKRSLLFVACCIILSVSVILLSVYVFVTTFQFESIAVNLSPLSASGDHHKSSKNIDVNAMLYSTKHYSWPTLLDVKVTELQCKLEFLGSGVGSNDGLPKNNFMKSTSYSITNAAIDEVKFSDLGNSNVNIYLDNTDYSSIRAVIWDYASMSMFSMSPAQSPRLLIDCSFDVSINSKLDRFIKFDVESPRIPVSFQHTLDLDFNPFDLASMLSDKKDSSKDDEMKGGLASTSTRNSTETGQPFFRINGTNAVVQTINEYCGQVTVFSRPIVFNFNMSSIQQYSFATDDIFIDFSMIENRIYYNSTLNEKYVDNSLMVTGSFIREGAATTSAGFRSDGFLENFVGSHR